MNDTRTDSQKQERRLTNGPFAFTRPLSPPDSTTSSLSTPSAKSTELKVAQQPVHQAQGQLAHYLHAKSLLAEAESAKAGLKAMKRLTGCSGEACFAVGAAYSTGLSGQRAVNWSKAFAYWSQGGKQGNADCCFSVASCYDLGLGTKRDCGKAVIFYRKAAALGHLKSMYKLGTVLLHGSCGLEASEREGISFLKRTITMTENGHELDAEALGDACYKLAQCYETSTFKGLIRDEAYALQLYAKAASLGNHWAHLRLGTAYEYGHLGLSIHPRQSLFHYQQAAERGMLPEAQLAISGWCLTGIAEDAVLPQSEQQAYIWARLAADQGLPKAEYALGHYSENGIGVPVDVDEAKRWYLKAARHGCRKAALRLKELKRRRSMCVVV